MDKSLIRQRFARALPTYDREATVQAYVARQLTKFINYYIPETSHNNVGEIGCGTGLFTRCYLQAHTPTNLWLNDICPEVEPQLATLLTDRICFEAGDAEHIRLPQKLNLIAICSALQWFDHPLRFLIRCKHALTSDGYIALSTFGTQNFREIHSLTGLTLPYKSLDNWQTNLQAIGYDIVYATEEHIVLNLPSPTEVLHHLKQTGVTGICKQAWTKKDLKLFSTHYYQHFETPDKQVTLTYHPIYFILKNKIHYAN